MKSRLFVLALVAGIVLISSSNVLACTCGLGGGVPCQDFWLADAVFAGTVVANSTTTLEVDNLKFARRLVQLTVDQPIRGMESAEVEVFTGLGGTDCGYDFKVGQRYLVYASRQGKEKRLFTSTCTRTRLLSEADDDFAFIRTLPTASANGLIFGTITRRNNQWKEGEPRFTPVAGVELTIEAENVQHAARSDSQGKFRVENVLPGKYKGRLKIPPGLIRPSGRDPSGPTYELEIEVAARGCAQADYYLESDTSVRGRVLDANGNPIANLELNMRGAGGDQKTVNIHESATTDADGSFEFKSVVPGDYLIGYHIFNAPLPGQEGQLYPRTYLPGVNSIALAKIISVKEGEVLSGLSLQMPLPLTPRTITSTVVWSDGQPVDKASVFFSVMEEGGPASLSWVIADADGRFTLKLRKGLQYKVAAFWQGIGGRRSESEYLDIPLTSDQPLRLVLPAQFRN